MWFLLPIFPLWILVLLSQRWDPGYRERSGTWFRGTRFGRWFVGLRVWQRLLFGLMVAAALSGVYLALLVTIGLVVYVVGMLLLYVWFVRFAWSAWKRRGTTRPSG